MSCQRTALLLTVLCAVIVLPGCTATIDLHDTNEVALLEGRSYLAGYIPLRVYLAVEEVDAMDVEFIKNGAYVLRASLVDETIDPEEFEAALEEQLGQVSGDDKLDDVLKELIPILARELKPLILQVWLDPDPDEALKKEVTRKCLIAVLRGVENACDQYLRGHQN